MRKISIFGFTGSIGTQALELLDGASELEPHIFVCNKSVDRAEKVLDKFQPKYIFFEDKDASNSFNSKKYPNVELIRNKQTLVDIIEADPSDIFLSAITSYEMMDITYLIAKSGKKVLLANKESLVIFGDNLMKEIDKHKTEIIPIDSEHYSIYHSLKNTSLDEIKKVFLMASGGPFFGSSISEIKNKSVEEALNHPNWEMGNKITIDSATLVNKCFEVIEAHHLFKIEFEKLGILIEPQSLIHSLVEFVDGSIEAQISVPSMSFPISYGLFNERSQKLAQDFSFDFSKTTTSFSIALFPEDRNFLLEITRDIIENKQNRGLIFASINDFAVKKFLKKEISFGDIYNLIQNFYESFEKKEIASFDELKINIEEIKESFKKG